MAPATDELPDIALSEDFDEVHSFIRYGPIAGLLCAVYADTVLDFFRKNVECEEEDLSDLSSRLAESGIRVIPMRVYKLRILIEQSTAGWPGMSAQCTSKVALNNKR